MQEAHSPEENEDGMWNKLKQQGIRRETTRMWDKDETMEESRLSALDELPLALTCRQDSPEDSDDHTLLDIGLEDLA